MKTFLAIATVVLSAQLFATTEQVADELFNNRHENQEGLVEAAQIYLNLATNNRGVKQADLFQKQSFSLYLYASRISDVNQKKVIFKNAFEAADKSIRLYTNGDEYSSTPTSPELKTKLAEAHYLSAISMGKWGEARGLLASLGQWKFMKRHIDASIANDPTVYEWGAYRTLGRALMKLPFTHGGSKQKSEARLKEAYDKTMSTMDDVETSTNTTTTAYYLDVLMVRNKEEKFCEVYEGFEALLDLDEEDLEALNPRAYPEAIIDLENFENSEGYQSDIHDYYDLNC